MEDEKPSWIDAIGVLIVSFILATLALVAAGGWTWYADFLHSALPNWIQGIGTVIAIFVAGDAVRRQIRANHEVMVESQRLAAAATADQLRLQQRDFLMTFLEVIDTANFVLQGLPNTQDGAIHRWEMQRTELQRLKDSLDRMPSGIALGIGVVRARNALSFALSNLLHLADDCVVNKQPRIFDKEGQSIFGSNVATARRVCVFHLRRLSNDQEIAEMEEALAESWGLR